MLPAIRSPLEARTPEGLRIRIRPVPLLNRWVLDVWDAQGLPLYTGRPLAVNSNPLSILTTLTLSPLLVTGSADPSATRDLRSQGIGFRRTPPSEAP